MFSKFSPLCSEEGVVVVSSEVLDGIDDFEDWSGEGSTKAHSREEGELSSRYVIKMKITL